MRLLHVLHPFTIRWLFGALGILLAASGQAAQCLACSAIEDDRRLVALAATVQDSWTHGAKRLLFMRLIFPDDLSEPISQSAAAALMAGASEWYVEKSYGLTSITSDITPPLLMPESKSWYSFQSLRTFMDHARAAAQQAGYNTNTYQFDIARFNSVPGWTFSATAITRGKGMWLQSSDLGVVVHELGHNYGLEHANLWAAGADSIIGPGTNSEYGNIFDAMGQPNANPEWHHFNVAWLQRLGWLQNSFVAAPTNGGTYRLQAFDVPALSPGATYALRIRKDASRDYWAEFRHKFSANAQDGIILNWSPWESSRFGTHLLDTMPETPAAEDAPLVVGRTFSDRQAGIHITPLAVSGAGTNRSIDVRVHLGFFTNNTMPLLNITADRTNVAVGEAVVFNAVASDGDGDALAYHWDFGDASISSNSVRVVKQWASAEQYAVRCVTSDMKGGVASRFLVITVGSPNVFQVSGRITNEFGAPLHGARVHNGQSGSAYRGTFTDSEGNYSLVNLAAGTHNLSVVQYGRNFFPAGWSNPITVGPNASDRAWAGLSYPAVNVVAADASAGEADSGADTGVFTISREGAVNFPLTIKFALAGTAELWDDFLLSAGGANWPYSITLAAGARSTNIVVAPLDDPQREGTETVTLTLLEDVGYVIGASNAPLVTIADSLGRIIPYVDWEPPAAIVYGTPLGAEQLNAFSFDEGTFAYEPSAGTVLDAGLQQTLAAIFTPNDLLRYEPVTNYVQIDVAPATTAGVLTSSANPAMYGQPITFTFSVTANPPSAAMPSGSAVFTVQKMSAVAPIVNGVAVLTLTNLSPGTHTVEAQFSGNNNFVGTTSFLQPAQNITIPRPTLMLAPLGDSTFQVRVTGVPRMTYFIEYKDDLQSAWRPLRSVTTDDQGVFEVTDNPANSVTQRFYRVHFP